MQRAKAQLVEAALDNVTESESCPKVTLTFSSVQLAASNRDQNMSGNATFISGDPTTFTTLTSGN